MAKCIIDNLIDAKKLWVPIDNNNSQDLTNQTFNNLTGVYRTKNENNTVYWVWQCKCGNYIKTSSSSVKAGKTKSCGCIPNTTNLIDLTGQKFDKWTVLEKAPSRNGHVYWLCQCKCGNIKEVKADSLRSGRSKSCGCLQKELLKERIKSTKGNKIKHLEGQTFGDLKVIELFDLIDNHAVWKCQCSCGNIINVQSRALITNKKQNCGCKNTISRGENKIRDLLIKNNLQFIQQASTILGCKYPDTNISARFDFYVNNSYIIEYDGDTHFQQNIGNGWITKEKYLYTKSHDDYKNQWCKEHNIPIIRIPYTHYDDIIIQDLLPETSQFLIS